MSINRERLVRRHNPVLLAADTTSPLSVGNGELGFTADVTGMQTLYAEYEEAKMPLCTQSQWGWHTAPVSKERYAYTQADLVETEYDFCGRKVTYPVKRAPGNEDVYNWLRENPHRLNLGRIGLLLDGREIRVDELSEIRQELDLYRGILISEFTLASVRCHVETACDPKLDLLGFTVSAPGLAGRLSVLLAFPYGSQKISASDFSNPDAHETIVTKEEKPAETGSAYLFARTLDRDHYICRAAGPEKMTVSAYCEQGKEKKHWYSLGFGAVEAFSFTVGFAPDASKDAVTVQKNAEEVLAASTAGWLDFWTRTGVIELYGSKDPRANELERRIVLSQYLMAINSSGSVPPQETGLTCNSWYGKFHLEMYFWHEGYLPLWGRTDQLERSLPWFEEHLPEAKANAAKNGYAGARWPKMVGLSGIDCPSPIAPLLVWQQPHLIYMLHLGWLDTKNPEFMRRYYPLVRESADFMADFAVKNENGEYELVAPLIPVQECHPALETRNPVFEVEYWVFGLKIAIEWAKQLGEPVPEAWKEVSEHMIASPIGEDGCYRAHSNCTETYGKYAKDHPSFLMAYGVIDTGRMDACAMERSLERSLTVWDEASLWGWDFAVMAMTAVKLGRPDFAIELILKDTLKNVYVASGNNRQVSRDDLPLYLPGNGSLLLAAAMMTAGYEGCTCECPGFPKDGNWTVAYEGIHPLPMIR